MTVQKYNAATAWFRDHQEFTVIEWPSRSPYLNPIDNLWGIVVIEWTDRNERTPDVLERHYKVDNGSRTKPHSGQNPPPTKIPLQPKTTADKNSPPGERVVITKN